MKPRVERCNSHDKVYLKIIFILTFILLLVEEILTRTSIACSLISLNFLFSNNSFVINLNKLPIALAAFDFTLSLSSDIFILDNKSCSNTELGNSSINSQFLQKNVLKMVHDQHTRVIALKIYLFKTKASLKFPSDQEDLILMFKFDSSNVRTIASAVSITNPTS